MNRRNTVRVIAFSAALSLIFAGFAFKRRSELKSYRLQIQNGYSRSLEELLSGVNNISLILEKNYIKNPKPNGYRSLHNFCQAIKQYGGAAADGG